MAECLCDHISKLKDTDAFNFKVGPINLKRARPTQRGLLEADCMNGVASTPDEIMVSSVAQYSPFASCNRSDVVLIKVGGNAYEAGEVWMHASVRGVADQLDISVATD